MTIDDNLKGLNPLVEEDKYAVSKEEEKSHISSDSQETSEENRNSSFEEHESAFQSDDDNAGIDLAMIIHKMRESKSVASVREDYVSQIALV